MKSFILSYKLRSNERELVRDSNYIDSKSCERSEGEDKNDNEVCEAHVNIWKVYVGTIRSRICFFYDFGLKITQKVGKIRLFIPFEIEENGKDYDLVRLLKNDNKLLCTVFNMDLKSDTSPKNAFSRVTSTEDEKEKFCLYQLGSNNFRVETVEIADRCRSKIIGSMLTITLGNKPEENVCKSDTHLYIRFRLQAKNVKDAVISDHISNDFLQDAFSEIDMIDFRMNEHRSVHIEAIDKMKEEGYDYFRFDKVHLFFMVETKEVVQNGSSLKSDRRLLEKELWRDYIPKGAKKSYYIAHHWKKEISNSKIGDNKKDDESFMGYSFFFTSQYPKINWMRLIVYLSVVILLSWVGSMLCLDSNQESYIQISSSIKIGVIISLISVVFAFFVITNYRLIVRLIKK